MGLIFLFFITPVILYGFVDLKPDIKSRNIKTAVIYIALSALSAVLCVCVLRGVNLKSPSDIVRTIVTAVLPPLG